MITLLYVLHFMVCFILIGVVLLQTGKGADVGAVKARVIRDGVIKSHVKLSEHEADQSVTMFIGVQQI